MRAILLAMVMVLACCVGCKPAETKPKPKPVPTTPAGTVAPATTEAPAATL